jgi:4-amino-4-deoxy-L-arabinose transferase-like glycosyltransferase
MTASEQSTTVPAPVPSVAAPRAVLSSARRGARVAPHHLALAGVLALSAVLNITHLQRNGYANIFYSASVKSMLRSLHNFFFVSFDPSGLISVDKPPLGLWVQAASAKAFGFSPLSLLLPEAIMGVLAVAALYWVMAPRFGQRAAVLGALALAVFPSFVAVSRDNNLDVLLVLLMILACGAALRAIETGRLRALLWSGVLVGLAFNTKTLAAYLVVPGIAAGYFVCAPGSISRRLVHLLAAGLVLLAVSAAWMAAVELTPASRRPFVGGSSNNTELGLTFGYNGFGRIGGQVGGPGRIPSVARHASLARTETEALHPAAARRKREAMARSLGIPLAKLPIGYVPPSTRPHPKLPAILSNGHERHPVAFGGHTGPLRLFGKGLGSQGGWLLPFALAGLIALALTARGRPSRRGAFARVRPAGSAVGHSTGTAPTSLGVESGSLSLPLPDPSPHAFSSAASAPRNGSASRGARRDPRLAGLIVLGGWFLVEAAVLSLSKGIVHPYYVSALGPGAAAMVGAGAVALLEPGRRPTLRLVLIGFAVLGSVAAQIVLLHRDHYMQWFEPLLIGGAIAGLGALVARPEWRGPATACMLGLLLVAPTVYAATTWEVPVEGTFPAAGPRAAGGSGGYGLGPNSLRINRELVAYMRTHRPGTRWATFTEASDTAAPMILLGLDAGAMGGYSGNDPALDGASLAQLLARGEARYVVIGGSYYERGGNRAVPAVQRACRVVPTAAWQSPPLYRNTLLLYDCAGREAALAAS